MKSKEAILCIDDEPIVLRLIKGQLTPQFGERFDLRFAGDAEEAREIVEELKANKQPLVMAIVDQLLPGQLGHEFLADLGKMYPNIIKILFSGQNDFNSAIKAINEAQIFRYLIKPWDEEDFKNIMERGLQQYYIKESIEVQLGEIHHRVKNNLTVITCLLELQRSELDSPIGKAYFQHSINRINSIARVHELIYDSDDMASVDIKNYLSRIIPSIQRTTKKADQQISVNINIPDYRMKVNQAIPMGLLFNELLTNSFSHAYSNREQGSISISMTTDWSRIHFVYEDDGIGFPSEVDFASSTKLGLTLINLQLQQLECTYNVQTKGKFRLEFSFDALRVKSMDEALGLLNTNLLLGNSPFQ